MLIFTAIVSFVAGYIIADVFGKKFSINPSAFKDLIVKKNLGNDGKILTNEEVQIITKDSEEK